MLQKINQFVSELKQSNSSIYKKGVLNSWYKEISDNTSCINKLLHYVYDYDKQYYVTSDNVIKHYEDSCIDCVEYTNVFELLDALRKRTITGNKAIHTVVNFVKSNEQYRDLILSILDKDLQVGISEATINKTVGDIISTFDVCLANKYNSKKHKLDHNWLIERKLDGCRCICIYKNKLDIKFYSRQGKEFTTLGAIKEDLERVGLPDNTVLDGEICLVDDNGNEDFQGIMKVIKRKDFTIKNPRYKVFDILTIREFEDKHGDAPYTERIARLKDYRTVTNFDSEVKTIDFVECVAYSQFNLDAWKEKVAENNWEGLMFRNNVGYEGKRTDNLLKFKEFSDNEYIVEGIEIGESQEVVNGVATKIVCVGALKITHKGNTVGVGSGLTMEQRKQWYENPKLIIGKTVTIKYFEETKDKNGKYSLRFPVLKAVFDKERDL